MKRILLLGFIMLHMNAMMQATTPIHFNHSRTDSVELKILSWNIYMLPYISLFNKNSFRAQCIADELNASEYQVIVFQEAFSSKCRSILARKLKSSFPYQYGPANKNKCPFRTNSGLWIVSKLPLTELDEIQFSVCKGFDAVARKGAALFEGTFNGLKFQLLATHLQADHSPGLRKKQCAEIKELLLNPYYHKDIPQFICGDFNIDMEDTFHYQLMLETLDAKNGALSGNIQYTYDELGNRLAYNAKGKRRIIDYVLVRNERSITKMDRKVNTFFTTMGGSESHLSDHYALEVRVNFAKSDLHTESELITAW